MDVGHRMFKTTKKHFNLFKKECDYWIKEFGLTNWCVRYYHRKDSKQEVHAWCNFEFSGRAVDITLNAEVDDDYKLNPEFETKLSAFHEVCEVLLFPLRYLAEARFLTDNEIDPEIHNIIRTLENAVFDKLR